MGGAGRKSREGCVETERMREGKREGGLLCCCSLRFGVEEGHVYGLRVGPIFLIRQCNPVPSAKDTSASGQSLAIVR